MKQLEKELKEVAEKEREVTCTHIISSIQTTRIYTTHNICMQERKKRTEEKKQRRLENQKKAEVVQKVCTIFFLCKEG